MLIVKILLVDDHVLFLEGLCLFLQKLPFKVDVLSVSSIEAAEKVVEENSADIDLALVDLNLPKSGGVFLVRKLSSKKNLIPTIIVSAEEDRGRIKKGLRAGAHGFIPKSLSGDDMIAAILHVLDGGYYLPAFLNYYSVRDDMLMPDDRRRALGITRRQYDTLLLMSRGLSNKEVAEHLFLSENTVKSHTGMLFQILDVTNRTECVLRAKKLSLVE